MVADEPERGERADRIERRYRHPFAMVPVALIRDVQVSHAALRCWAVLASFENRHTHRCTPARETIARQMRCDERSVIRYLRELESAGWLSQEPYAPAGIRIGTQYYLYDEPFGPDGGEYMGTIQEGGDTAVTPLLTNLSPTRGDSAVTLNKIGTAEPDNSNKRGRSRAPDAVVSSPTALPAQTGARDTDAVREILAAIEALAPGADATAVPGWVAQYGAERVVERARWLRAELAAGTTIASPMGWLYRMLSVAEPPLAYRRQLQARKRATRQQAQREAQAARAEQAATASRERTAWLQEVRRRYTALPADRQTQVDILARQVIAQRPFGVAWTVPPVPDVWAAQGPGSALYCVEVARLLGIPAAE